MIIRHLAKLSLAGLLAVSPVTHAHDGDGATVTDSSITPAAQEAVDVIERFSGALKAGDLARAGSFLAEDVLVLESGGVERSRAEYLGGHAAHDAAFLKNAHVQVKRRTARADGGLAWVGTESEIHASSKSGEPITLLSTESMVLERRTKGWQIVHIHWSSRPAPAQEQAK